MQLYVDMYENKCVENMRNSFGRCGDCSFALKRENLFVNKSGMAVI